MVQKQKERTSTHGLVQIEQNFTVSISTLVINSLEMGDGLACPDAGASPQAFISSRPRVDPRLQLRVLDLIWGNVRNQMPELLRGYG